MSTTFSVIVTCYNYRDFVEEAVDSALAQTRAAAQVIVVDDGSTDGSSELLRARYGDDPRVTLLFGENGGQLAAFQRGAAVASGDVLCFLDADDRWLPTHLEQIGALYDERRDVDFVFTDVQLFGDDQRLLAYADRALDLGYTVIGTCALAHWYGAPTSALSLRRHMALRCLDLPHGFRISFFHQLAAHEQAQALVPVALAELQPGHNAVVGGYAQTLVRGLYSIEFQRGQTAHGCEQLFANIRVFNRGQA